MGEGEEREGQRGGMRRGREEEERFDLNLKIEFSKFTI